MYSIRYFIFKNFIANIPETQILEFEKESYAFDYSVDDILTGEDIILVGVSEGVNYNLDGGIFNKITKLSL